MSTVLKINDNEWKQWLEIVATQNIVSGIECDAGLFLQQDFLETIRKTGINCFHTRDLLPADAAAAFQVAQELKALPRVYAHLYSIIQTAFTEAQADCFSLNFRLDRMDTPADEMQQMTQFLTQLQFVPLARSYTLLLPVRLPPPFPTSKELDRALSLCSTLQEMSQFSQETPGWEADLPHSTMKNGTVKLLLHIYPEEKILPEKAEEFLPSLISHTQSISFHYNVAASETLFDDEQRHWADLLQKLQFNGNVIFAPESCPLSQLNEVFSHIQHWAQFYQASCHS